MTPKTEDNRFPRRPLLRQLGAATALGPLAPLLARQGPALAAGPTARISLLAFQPSAGKLDVKTVWRSDPGRWSLDVATPFAADVGDRKNQPWVMYGYPNDNTALFAFDKTGKPEKVWESGPGKWSWNRSQVYAGDFRGTGRNEPYILYDVDSQVYKAALHVWGAGFKPETIYEWGENGLACSISRLISGDVFGTRENSLCILYNHSKGPTTSLNMFYDGFKKFERLWAFYPKFSGIETWAPRTSSQVVTADLRGKGKREICLLYEYPDNKNKTALFVFEDMFTPHKVWESGPAPWPCSRSKLVVADVRGRGLPQLCILHGSENGNATLFVFDERMKPQKVWESGAGKWDVGASRVFAATVDGNANALCALKQG